MLTYSPRPDMPPPYANPDAGGAKHSLLHICSCFVARLLDCFLSSPDIKGAVAVHDELVKILCEPSDDEGAAGVFAQ